MADAVANRIVPAPLIVEPGAGSSTLRDGDAVSSSHPALAPVVETFVAELATTGGPHLTTGDRGAVHVALVDDPAVLGAGLAPAAGVSPSGATPNAERYRLRIDGSGILVEATTPEGAYRGLTSLRQLIGVAAGGEVRLPAVRIDDAPRYAWRGLALDVVRTFFTVEQVKLVIDQLATFKCNVLHLHLTNDQGWRLHIDSRPRLTEVGARGAMGDRPGGFYTQADYRELVGYAAARFVTIVPEIDLPGHCAAAVDAYPDLGAVPAQIGPMRSGTLDPGRDAAMAFVRDVYGELAALTPARFLHLGADEAFGMADEPYARFVASVHELIVRLGKASVGWQESTRAGLGADHVVQHWIDPDMRLPSAETFAALGLDLSDEVLKAMTATFGQAAGDLPRALATGSPVLLSPQRVAYLDQPYAEPGPEDQEAQRARLGLPVYAGSTVRSAYEWDPLALLPGLGTDDQVAGIEAAIWCETVTGFEDLQFLLQPRLAAIAERAWVPAGTADWADFAARLGAQAPSWRAAGWSYFRASSVPWA